MKKIIITGLFFVVFSGAMKVNAQKTDNEVIGDGKIVEYSELGTIKMVINKDMIDRFKSIEVDENYITWNYLYSNYDWSTIQFIADAYRNNEIDITIKSDVERIVYVYRKSLETLYNTDLRKPQKEDNKLPLTTDTSIIK